jgi:hypothetical protein
VSSSSNRTRYRPELEACEARLALSTTVIANPLAVVNGTVKVPGSTAEVSFPVTPRNLNHRHSVVIGTTVAPGAGSGLFPAVKHARGPAGQRLPLHQGMPFIPGFHGTAQAYVRTPQPGPLTTGVTGRQGTTGNFQLAATLPGDINGDGQVTIADLQLFAKSYLTTRGDALYNPAADADHNGFVGHGDARLLLRNETPLTPKIPLSIQMGLAPGDEQQGPKSMTSGGVTRKEKVTIIGHTTPGSIVFADSGLGDYTFTGQALVPDTRGLFRIQVTNKEGLNNYNFLAIDPYGQQTIRDFPIFWSSFAAPGSKLK